MGIYLLGQTGYLIIAIGVIILLVALFFISYVLNKKTPIPEECKNLIDEEKCVGCQNITCSHYKEEIKEAIKEEGENK